MAAPLLSGRRGAQNVCAPPSHLRRNASPNCMRVESSSQMRAIQGPQHSSHPFAHSICGVSGTQGHASGHLQAVIANMTRYVSKHSNPCIASISSTCSSQRRLTRTPRAAMPAAAASSQRCTGSGSPALLHPVFIAEVGPEVEKTQPR